MSVIRIGGTSAKLKAPQRLVGADFERFRAALVEACVSAHPSIEIDLSGVESLDYSGLQLLVSALRTVSAQDGVLNVVQGSPELMAQLARYGFTGLLSAQGLRNAA